MIITGSYRPMTGITEYYETNYWNLILFVFNFHKLGLLI